MKPKPTKILEQLRQELKEVARDTIDHAAELTPTEREAATWRLEQAIDRRIQQAIDHVHERAN